MDERGFLADLEALLLDFLAYRKEKTKPTSRVAFDDTPQASVDTTALSAAIGKGWPHYKTLALPLINSDALVTAVHNPPVVTPAPVMPIVPPMPATPPMPAAPPTLAAYDLILTRLWPVVDKVMQQYDSTETTGDYKVLIDHTLAKATTIPEVGEILRASEVAAWGRLQLLQTVVVLLIGAWREGVTLPI